MNGKNGLSRSSRTPASIRHASPIDPICILQIGVVYAADLRAGVAGDLSRAPPNQQVDFLSNPGDLKVS